jgi:hypothetical protein
VLEPERRELRAEQAVDTDVADGMQGNKVTWSMSGDLGHELPKRCSRPGGVLTTELTGPDHGNSLVLENYHAARSHGPSDYIYDLLQVVFAGHYPFAVDTPT